MLANIETGSQVSWVNKLWFYSTVLLQQTGGVPWQWSVWDSESWCVELHPLQQQPWSGGSREVSGGRVNRGGKGEVPAGGSHHGTVQTSQHHQDSWDRHHLRPCEIVWC